MRELGASVSACADAHNARPLPRKGLSLSLCSFRERVDFDATILFARGALLKQAQSAMLFIIERDFYGKGAPSPGVTSFPFLMYSTGRALFYARKKVPVAAWEKGLKELRHHLTLLPLSGYKTTD